MPSKNYTTVNILLIEDDDIDAKTVKRALKKLRIGNPLIRAKDGQQALNILESAEIDRPYLILLDLNLPIINGIELLSRIRKNPKLQTSVVFVLTTSNADEDRFASYQHNVAGYIIKENLTDGFEELTQLLDHYWRIVELPDS